MRDRRWSAESRKLHSAVLQSRRLVSLSRGDQLSVRAILAQVASRARIVARRVVWQLRADGPAGSLALETVQQRTVRRQPDNVTIAGESAGGTAVLAHFVARSSGGLFRRAILESGSFALTQRSLAERRQFAGGRQAIGNPCSVNIAVSLSIGARWTHCLTPLQMERKGSRAPLSVVRLSLGRVP